MLIIFGIIFVFFVAADQLSKAIAVNALGGIGNTMRFIPGLIRFEYRQNTGMAWGLLPNAKWLFVILTVIVSAVIIYIIVRYAKRMPMLAAVSLTLILAGAFGNLIDRCALSYVRDFIAFDFSFYDFPVFNIADSCVTIGTALLFIAMLFTKNGRKFFGFFDNGQKKKNKNKNNGKTAADKTEEMAEAWKTTGTSETAETEKGRKTTEIGERAEAAETEKASGTEETRQAETEGQTGEADIDE